jgi:hypothetical protein
MANFIRVSNHFEKLPDQSQSCRNPKDQLGRFRNRTAGNAFRIGD